ncbi:Hypothetical predicted protein [Lecanosticta acicola]|uniref:Uncharacterized protein n=1 Tax=Lecanosticta acicola TaxID=111012 RepID=A0AAI9EEB8_9PEZI|nr:Hypothetical predicted protein [Lecanosticta acicola]
MASKSQQKRQSDNPNAQGSPKAQNVVDEREVRQESSKAARQAQLAKKKAKELRDAAAAAGDPEERQKLLEQAIDKEIEAESFGKTAKYLRSGTFQGMVMGTGIGVTPGLTLGVLTGTLVGGLTSLITGGLGAGIGALTGWIHGPFFNVGAMAGKGIQRITGNLPGWVATEKQKRTLEKMLGQIKEEDMPDDDELEMMGSDDGSDMVNDWGKKASATAGSYVPSWAKSKQDGDSKSGTPSKQSQQCAQKTDAQPASQQFPATQKAGDDVRQHLDKPQAQSHHPAGAKPSGPSRQETSAHETGKENVPPTNGRQVTSSDKPQSGQNSATQKLPETATKPTSSGAARSQQRKKPRKLETRSTPQILESTSGRPAGEGRRPRKLERRS